jgi:hypothetical protein
MTELLECPRHGGSFDCTPFCDLCEGNQEYDPDETQGHCSETLQDGVFIYKSRFTGTVIARCENCDYQSAFWQCYCDLNHNH